MHSLSGRNLIAVLVGMLGAILLGMNTLNTPTVRATESLPPVADLALTCPSGFEAYLMAIGCTRANLKPAKMPKF